MTSAKTIARDARVELNNARIVDIFHNGYYNPSVRIIIRNGRIEAMPGLPGQPEDLCPDFKMNLQGQAVIPGLFNTHSHIQLNYPSMLAGLGDMMRMPKLGPLQSEKRLADCFNRGITNVRDCLTSDLRPNQALKQRIEQHEIPGPRIHQCILVSNMNGAHTTRGNLFAKLMALLSGGAPDFEKPESAIVTFPVDASEDQVRAAVNRAIDERGAKFIKFYDQAEYIPAYKPGAVIMTDAQLQAAADQSRKRGVRTTMHLATLGSFRRAVGAGVNSLAHLPMDAPLAPEDVEAFIASDCAIEPTLTIAYYLSWMLPTDNQPPNERMQKLNELREASFDSIAQEFWIPELAASAQLMDDKVKQGKFKLLGLIDMSAAFHYWHGMISMGADNLYKLYRAGACITASNDAGAVPASEAMLSIELKMLEMVLNPPEEPSCFRAPDALRFATLNSARALGLEDSFGSIEPGKIADLAIVSGDPLTDISCIGSPVSALFYDGCLVLGNDRLHVEPNVP